MVLTDDMIKRLDNMGLIFLTTSCIEHDIKELKKGNNTKFDTIENILEFYQFSNKEYIYKKYIKTFGLIY